MVSAVFHTSLDTKRAAAAKAAAAGSAAPAPAPALSVVGTAPSAVTGAQSAVATAPLLAAEPAPARAGIDWRAVAMTIVPPIVAIAILIVLWGAFTKEGGGFPTPGATFAEALKVFADPFYKNGPNDQGIGWNILFSLYRVAIGFGLAAAVGIPLGFIIGRFEIVNAATSPLISLLRPVSPLAWLPIGLLVFKAANPAAIWTIFICSIWPMIINTAVGVQRVPVDYLNVARVLNLSEWKVVTRILFPAVLPYMLTGVRLSVGTAWLVIVAAEMLTGGVGIGFWVWDEWNNLNVKHILIAILVIGVVGLILEWALIAVAKRFTYSET